MRPLQSRSVLIHTEMNKANKLMGLDSLPDSAMIRACQLVTRPGRPGLLPFSNTTLWRRVKEGTFPKPVKLSRNVTAWKIGTLRGWLAQFEGKAQP